MPGSSEPPRNRVVIPPQPPRPRPTPTKSPKTKSNPKPTPGPRPDLRPKEDPTKEFIRPIRVNPNPKSKVLIWEFVESNSNHAHVDTSWTNSPRKVYDRLRKYLEIHDNLGINVFMSDGNVFLQKVNK